MSIKENTKVTLTKQIYQVINIEFLLPFRIPNYKNQENVTKAVY